MNKEQLILELKKDFPESIINAFIKVNREDFVPDELKKHAYENQPLPIGKGATISQPYTIAFMLDLLELDRLKKDIINVKIDKLVKTSKSRQSKQEFKASKLNDTKIPKILEVGSGSGYVLALMDEIVPEAEIIGIEINKELVEKSKKALRNKKNIKIISGEGSKGVGKKMDRILVSASADKIPDRLINQLKEDGVMVIPVRDSIFQIKKKNKEIIKREFPGFVFVPLING